MAVEPVQTKKSYSKARDFKCLFFRSNSLNCQYEQFLVIFFIRKFDWQDIYDFLIILQSYRNDYCVENLIFQNWLISWLFANIIHHLKLADEYKWQFSKLLVQIRIKDFGKTHNFMLTIRARPEILICRSWKMNFRKIFEDLLTFTLFFVYSIFRNFSKTNNLQQCHRKIVMWEKCSCWNLNDSRAEFR